MILIAGCILLTGSVFWAAIFRLPNKTAYLLAIYLLSIAQIILATYVANTFLALNQQGVLLALHLALLLIGWFAWRMSKKPVIFAPFSRWEVEWAVAIRWLSNRPTITFMMLTMGALYLFGLAQIIFIPQNSMDGLSTYLSRVGFWLQNGSFFPWTTNQLGQVVYPVNAQLQIFWGALFSGSDHLAGITQWIAVLISGLGVWGLSRLFGYSKEQAAYSSVLYLSLPLIILQSTTVQTDVVTSAFFITAIYFLFSGLKSNDNRALILFAISLGLGVGTKKSFLLFLPIFAIIGLGLTLVYKRNVYKKLSFLLVTALLGIGILGAYQYASNWYHFGSIFGSDYISEVLQSPHNNLEIRRARAETTPSYETNVREAGKPPLNTIGEELLYNVPRILYQFADVSGLPRPLSGYAQKAKAYISRAFFQALGFGAIEGNVQTAPGHVFDFSTKNDGTEDDAWYGPLGFLLILPAMLVGFKAGIQEKNPLKLIPLLSFLFFLPFEVILRPGWDPYQGRYFAPLIALATPLVSELFNAKRRPAFIYTTLAFAIFLGGVSVLYNPSKPTLGKFSDEFNVWNNERIFVQTIQRHKERELYLMIEEYVEPDAVLAYRMPGYFLNYPLFGENFSRTLLPITNNTDLQNIDWAREMQVDYLLITVTDSLTVPDEYRVVDDVRLWQLYRFYGK